MEGLISDMSSEAYHSFPNTFSSSQLKTILEDPELFYRKYITKSIEKEEMSAFDIGTFFHCAILEPEKLSMECAVYGGVRRGKEWTTFKEANIGKAIITKSELESAETLIAAVKASTIAQSFLTKGQPEVSCFVSVYIYAGDIYAKGCVLKSDGWERIYSGDFTLAMKAGVKLVIKVRADLLGEGFILDLKSTTGNCKSDHLMRSKISAYSYDLSASLYLDMFTIGSELKYDRFLWCFASKDYGNSKTYVASPNNVKIGRAKYKKALLLLADNITKNWVMEESLGVLEPQFFENEWLSVKESVEL